MFFKEDYSLCFFGSYMFLKHEVHSAYVTAQHNFAVSLSPAQTDFISGYTWVGLQQTVNGDGIKNKYCINIVFFSYRKLMKCEMFLLWHV